MINTSLSQQAVRSGIWMLVLRVTYRLCSLVRTVVLARLLAPGDFGLVGIALLSLQVIEIFSETGFQVALIQKKQDVKLYLDSAWTIQVIRGVILFAFLYLAAPLAATFFNSDKVVPVLRVIAAAVLFGGFVNIGVIYFQKELEFRKQFIYEFSVTLVDLVVAASLAFVLRNAWALVFGLLAASMARCIMSYIIHPYRPRLEMDWAKVKELFRYGKWILFSTILAFIGAHGDDIVVGKVIGVIALGFYQMAYQFSQLIVFEIFYITSKVGVPVYSKIQDNLINLKAGYSRIAGLSSSITFPVTIGIAILAGEFTRIFLGEKWLPMVPALTILAVAALIESIVFTGKPLFVGGGKPKFEFQIQLLKALIIIVLIYPFALLWGITGAAIAVMISVLSTGVLFYRNLKIHLNITPRHLGNIFMPPLAASVAMGGLIYLFKFLTGFVRLDTMFVQVAMFLVTVVFAVVIYFSIVCLFQRMIPDYQVLKDLVRVVKRV